MIKKPFMDRITKLYLYAFLILFAFVPVMLHYSDISVFCFMAGTGLTLFFVLKCKRIDFALRLFLSALVIRVVTAAVIHTPVESDFALLLDASQKLNAGDMSFLETAYFQKWDYQMGFVFYQSLLLRIWNSVDFLKLVNCLFSAGNTLLIYLIAEKFVSRRSAKVVSVLYCIFPFSVFYVAILSNQFASSFLCYLSLYLLLTKKPGNEYVKYLLVAGLLVLANILRPESIIPLVSVGLYLLLTIRKHNCKRNLACFFLLLSAYFLLKLAVGKLFAVSGIAPYGLSNNDPLWKFVLGFDHESGGSYKELGNYYANDTEALALIRDRILQPPHRLVSLFLRKIRTFWYGSATSWVFDPIAQSGSSFLGFNFPMRKLGTLAGEYSAQISFVLYLLLLVGLWGFIRKGNRESKLLILISQMFVTFGVYLLIEVQPRYIYHVQLSVFILAAVGIDRFAELLRNSRPGLISYLEGRNRK